MQMRQDLAYLLDFCETERQREKLSAVVEYGYSKARVMLNLKDERALKRDIASLKEKAESRGVDPSTKRNHLVPEGQVVSGYSELVKAAPDDPLNRIIYWVKTNRKITDQLDSAKSVLEAMASEIEPIKSVKYRGRPKTTKQFTVIPVGDPHIGLRTWSKEVGTDWDVHIAKQVFKSVFTRLMTRAPDTEEVVLINTGDFFHADNIQGETSRSKHKLDLDGRPAYWLDAGVVIMRMLIDACLSKYKKVHFYNVPGNHDDILGLSIGAFAAHLYDKNPRIEVHRGENPFQYFKKGKVLLGFAHGHTCKLASLPGKMADDQYELWGQTTERHWITGHVHHDSWQQFKQHPGATVETVGIIPPKDAYAHGGAYGGKRGTQLIIYDQDLGEIERYRESVYSTDAEAA